MGGRNGESTDEVLEKLRGWVADVYQNCGFEADAALSTLNMLANIESKMEEYLTIVDKMPPAFVEEAEKAREKERRQRAREEKMEAQRSLQEERMKRAIERAKAPVQKKVGKP